MPHTSATGTAILLQIAYFSDSAAGLIKQQKLEEALEDCRQSLKLSPDYARAHGRMGLIHESHSCVYIPSIYVCSVFRYVYSTQGQYAEAKIRFTEVYHKHKLSMLYDKRVIDPLLY